MKTANSIADDQVKINVDDQVKINAQTRAHDMKVVDALSNGMVALLWRCLDGFDGWFTRRSAVRWHFGLTGSSVGSIAGPPSWLSMESGHS